MTNKTLYKTGLLASLVFLSLCLNACDSAPPSAPESPSANLNSEIEKYHPDDAIIRLANPLPKIGSADKVSSLQVPTLSLTFIDATMAQILRCDVSHELETTTGQELQAIKTGEYSFADLEQAKWIWKGAFGSGKCKLVGSRIARENFQDLAAKPGSFYYLINPCVAQQLSTTNEEGCSNKLVKSEALENYTNSVNEEFIDKSVELSEVENQLTAYFINLRAISYRLHKTVQACETERAIKQADSNMMKGLVSLVATAVGAVVGGYVGGPMGAVKGGETMLGIAQGIMGKIDDIVMVCPALEKLKDEAQTTIDAIEPQVQKVISIRTEMASLESSYHDLDSSIASQTGSD